MANPNDTPVGRRLQHITHIIIVCSGKGGVGKSSVSTQLALALYASSPTTRVALLDTDLTGPSIPRMLRLSGHPVHQSSDGWVPVYADGAEARLGCMSVGFLLKRREDSVVWRGPKKNAMIRQFLADVRWGELDYLVIDTPPGTSDEHLSLMEHMAPVHSRVSAVLVTTPQAVALLDAMKCLSFTRTVNVPVLGLIENMSGYACPCCGKVSNVFSTGGGEAMAKREGLKFLGSLPVDTELVTLLDAAEGENEGKDVAEGNSEEKEKGTLEKRNVEAELEQKTVSGTGGALADSAKSSFELLEKYLKTPTAPLFLKMAEEIVRTLRGEGRSE